MTRSTEDEALRQLQQEQSNLLDKIDELRTIGVGGLVELPQLIVCGNQSSGKSSVLEAISRVRFPANSNVCTRFPTEVILRRSPVSKIRISIEPGSLRSSDDARAKHLKSFNHEAFSDGNDLPALINRAKEHMGVSHTVNSGFSEDVLKVEISGPEKPELTLVDLPGLYYSTSQQQGKDGIAIVRRLTEKYMANSRSIILAVISASMNYHIQEVLNMAEAYDKGRDRTLGIITQPDILEASSEEEASYLRFMRNERMQLQLGWHALRNRSSKTQDISDEARDKQEKDFFNHGAWSTIPRQHVGVDSLRRRLSSILLKHIQHNLPGLIADIQNKITDREQKLSKLGPPRSTLQEKRGFLLGISSAFERITGQALNGMYADEFFSRIEGLRDVKYDGRVLRATIRQLNEFFAAAMATRGSKRIIVEGKQEPSPSFSVLHERTVNPYMAGWTETYVSRRDLEAEASALARRNRGIELPGSANQLLVGSLFRDQSQPWAELARTHLLSAWDAVRYFVSRVLQHLTDEHTSSLLLAGIIEPELEKMKQALLDKLEELTAYTKRGHPLPIGKSFLTQIQKGRTDRLLESLKAKLTLTSEISNYFSMTTIEQAVADLETSRDEFATAEIVDQMQAYYDIAILTFVDNVATLGIENCLLDPLQRIFTSQVVNKMEDCRIQSLAAEPAYINQERVRLSGELEKLQAGVRTFIVFRPMMPALGNRNAPTNPTATPSAEKAKFAAPKSLFSNIAKDVNQFSSLGSSSPATNNTGFGSGFSIGSGSAVPTDTTAPFGPATKTTGGSGPATSSSGLFGAPSTSTTGGSGLFGSATNSAGGTGPGTSSSKLFGAPSTSATGGSGLFGSATNSTGGTGSETSSSKLFGAPSTSATGGSGLFGPATNSLGGFGPATSSSKLFGAPSTSTSTTTTTSGSGLFNSATKTTWPSGSATDTPGSSKTPKMGTTTVPGPGAKSPLGPGTPPGTKGNPR
ncbi:P-loop containing nucleoside triphosphate hydrolase protein [Aspergillus varians]